MHNYLCLLNNIYTNGVDVFNERTGTETRSLFGYQMRFDLSQGFPMVTTRKVYFKTIVEELLWMLSGSSDNRVLNDNRVHIWDKWEITQADLTQAHIQMNNGTKDYDVDTINSLKPGSLGPVYGSMWRHWNKDTVDQIKNVTDLLRNDPSTRRAMVTAYDPSLASIPGASPSENILRGKQVLPPCHPLFQFNIQQRKDDIPRLSLHLYARSQDVPVGTVYNIAFYAALTHVMAFTLGIGVGDYIHTCGDAHIYHDQLELVKEQLTREPLPLPTLAIEGPQIQYPYEITRDHFKLTGYKCFSRLDYPVTE